MPVGKIIKALTKNKKKPKVTKIPMGKRTMSEAQMNKAVKERLGKGVTKAGPDYRNRPLPQDLKKKGKTQEDARRMKGAKAREEDVKKGKKETYSTSKKSGGKVIAKADWMDGLSQKEIDEILGKPTRDSGGVKRHSGKTKPKSKTRRAKAGGSIGCGKALRGHGKGPYKKKK